MHLATGEIAKREPNLPTCLKFGTSQVTSELEIFSLPYLYKIYVAVLLVILIFIDDM